MHDPVAGTPLARAAAADRRARSADDRANSEEALAVTGLASLRAMHLRLAALHRAGAEESRGEAAWYRIEADWADASSSQSAIVSRADQLVRAVSRASATASVALVLQGRGGAVVDAYATDRRARMAQDLEFVLGVGPLHEVCSGSGAVVAFDEELEERWPAYGAGLAGLGVSRLVAIPFGNALAPFGAIGLLDPPVDWHPGHLLSLLSGTVVANLLDAPSRSDDDTADSAMSRFHQAVGMLATRLGCDLPTAAAVLRARAFADDEESDVCADRVSSGELDVST